MFQIILCNCPNTALAKKIAHALVETKLAACVNILPGLMSVYRWQDNIECDDEVQLIIKSTKAKFSLICDEIIRLHSYDTPEIIALNIQQGNNDYLNWIKESLK